MTGGTLYICATPIGNLQDISARVLDTLREADLIAAEDTRHSLGLLTHYDIRRPMISYHEHNKYERAQEIVGRLLAGENVALITDAGTPVISDPGEVLVKAAREAGIPVTSLPGPCALITALTLSGLPARRFVFEGFLPMDKKERRQVLEDLTRRGTAHADLLRGAAPPAQDPGGTVGSAGRRQKNLPVPRADKDPRGGAADDAGRSGRPV